MLIRQTENWLSRCFFGLCLTGLLLPTELDAQPPCDPKVVWNNRYSQRTQRSAQIALEVRFITVRQRILKNIGVDFDFDVNAAPCDPEFNGTGDSFPFGELPTPLPNPFDQPNLLGLPAHTGIDFALFQLNSLNERQQLLDAISSFQDSMVYLVETELADGDVVTLGDPANQAEFQGWKLPGLGMTLKSAVTTDQAHVWVSMQPFYHGLIPTTTFSPLGGEMQGGTGNPVSSFPQGPLAKARSAASVVMLGNDQTLVLGGLTRQPADRDRAAGALANLPFINRLFQNVGLGRETTSVMLMVTPRIIIKE
jgi:hypothetical protein